MSVSRNRENSPSETTMKTTAALFLLAVAAASAQSDHAEDLEALSKWCPLDHKLSGLNLGYCNEDKNHTEAADILGASEMAARKVLLGGAEPENKCGLCSALLDEKNCSKTTHGEVIPFSQAIQRDEYQNTRNWCILGKTNMKVCRNFGAAEGAAAGIRTKLCQDLRSEQHRLDSLRALEFGVGDDGHIAEVVEALGQEKTYQILGLGGCLDLLEAHIALKHIFAAIRPDACAVVCVKALASPDTPVMDIVDSVYKGFVQQGTAVYKEHKMEYNKTGIVKVLKNVDKVVKTLEKKQAMFRGTMEKQHKIVVTQGALRDALEANATHEREELKKYNKRIEEYKKKLEAFKNAKALDLLKYNLTTKFQREKAKLAAELKTKKEAEVVSQMFDIDTSTGPAKESVAAGTIPESEKVTLEQQNVSEDTIKKLEENKEKLTHDTNQHLDTSVPRVTEEMHQQFELHKKEMTDTAQVSIDKAAGEEKSKVSAFNAEFNAAMLKSQ